MTPLRGTEPWENRGDHKEVSPRALLRGVGPFLRAPAEEEKAIRNPASMGTSSDTRLAYHLLGRAIVTVTVTQESFS